MEAQRILAERYGVAADTWAVTSWTTLRTDALEVERWNRLHPEAEPRTAVVTDGARRRARSGGGHHRLHARRARPGGALRRPALRLARDRRLRPLRRPGRPAVVLRGRQRQPGRRRAAAAGRWAGGSKPSVVAGAIADFGIDADALRPRSSSEPCQAASRAHEGGQRLLGAVGHRQDSVRRSASSASDTSKKAQHCFSRWASATAAVRAASESRSTRRTAVAPASTEVTDERHQGTPLVGPLPNDRRVEAAGDRHRPSRRRHRRCAATSASRVISIWPRCWNSSSRMCSSTAPLVSV